MSGANDTWKTNIFNAIAVENGKSERTMRSAQTHSIAKVDLNTLPQLK
jgi:hypothetical protein